MCDSDCSRKRMDRASVQSYMHEVSCDRLFIPGVVQPCKGINADKQHVWRFMSATDVQESSLWSNLALQHIQYARVTPSLFLPPPQ